MPSRGYIWKIPAKDFGGGSCILTSYVTRIEAELLYKGKDALNIQTVTGLGHSKRMQKVLTSNVDAFRWLSITNQHFPLSIMR